MARSRLPWSLARRELRHEWQSAVCFVAALVGILAPLLVMLALKNGMIGTMVGRLVEDPSNREILAVGAGRYGADFYDGLAARPDVAFLLPSTRSINAQANAVRNADARQLERAVTLIPSAPGDPLVGAPAVSDGTLWVTATLAEKLGAAPGATLEMIIEREIDGRAERVRRDLSVGGIVPRDLYGRDAVFLSLNDLQAVERFRDDRTITPDTWTDARPAPDTYASFRLYAATLSDIGPLLKHLDALGAQARPRAENAELLLNFRQNLNLIYTLLATLAVIGFWAAMAANLRGMVERQRIVFSLLDLLGLPTRDRQLVPVLQGQILVQCGILLTLVIVLPVTFGINLMFADGGPDVIATLGWRDVLATMALGAVTGVTATVWALRAIVSIKPSEVLRRA